MKSTLAAMFEPPRYILEEWDSMCAIANKERQGNCPLIEDEVLVEMHKYVGAQDKRIAELEQDRAIRDLEQQAKGIEDALKFEKEQSNRMAFGGLSEFVLSKYANQLREHAKQLNGRN